MAAILRTKAFCFSTFQPYYSLYTCCSLQTRWTHFLGLKSLFLWFQLLYYSAHYGTMFSLFTALGLNKATNDTLRRIPYYASLLFIELLQDSSDGNKFFVRFSFKNGLEVSSSSFSLKEAQHPEIWDDYKPSRIETTQSFIRRNLTLNFYFVWVG